MSDNAKRAASFASFGFNEVQAPMLFTPAEMQVEADGNQLLYNEVELQITGKNSDCDSQLDFPESEAAVNRQNFTPSQQLLDAIQFFDQHSPRDYLAAVQMSNRILKSNRDDLQGRQLVDKVLKAHFPYLHGIITSEDEDLLDIFADYTAEHALKYLKLYITNGQKFIANLVELVLPIIKLDSINPQHAEVAMQTFAKYEQLHGTNTARQHELSKLALIITSHFSRCRKLIAKLHSYVAKLTNPN